MKINIFLVFICAALAGLSAFGFYMANEGDTYRVLITVGSAISLFITLGGTLALTSPNRGSIVNIRVISGIFFLVLLIEHIIFSFSGVRFTPYIVITGILALFYILLCYITMRALRQNG